MAENELIRWYKDIPVISRYWLSGCFVFPVASHFGFINPMNLLLFYQLVVKRFQLWRLLTCGLYYPFGFPYLMNLFFIYSYSSRLEANQFPNDTAGFAFCILFLWLCNVVLGLAFSFPLIMDSMIMSVVYVWCQFNRNVIVSFLFGMQFKAIFMPWVILAFHWIVSGSIAPRLSGIFVGHLYYFLRFRYPLEYNGPNVLKTPQILQQLFPPSQPFGFSSSPSLSSRNRQAFTGSGRRLGDH